jgi:hypothetical protein
LAVERRSSYLANDGIAQSSRYGDDREMARALRSERPAGAAEMCSEGRFRALSGALVTRQKDRLRRHLKNGLSHCPQRACRRAHGRQGQGAGTGLSTIPDPRFARRLSDRQRGGGMSFSRGQRDGDHCTGTTEGDDAGGQAAIPSASLFADGKGCSAGLQPFPSARSGSQGQGRPGGDRPPCTSGYHLSERSIPRILTEVGETALDGARA